eukprot:TRINITY_DN42821_c0_g1_i1.p1 TRINITY_DN42821_c0_g1~~TRINITY_DN42821_c0_g1_i1.p1  ORF type:complete len:594 (+),score=184.72 TRINITY_DN42821_c0_g1_i1:89-1870(+)
MPAILGPHSNSALYIGRLPELEGAHGNEAAAAAAAGGDGLTPEHLRWHGASRRIQASDAAGLTRDGGPSDFRAELYWMLMPTAGGRYALRPLAGWYEFSKPSGLGTSSSSSAAPSKLPTRSGTAATPVAPSAGKKRKAEETGEAVIRADAAIRKQHSDRWEQMLRRRANRFGVERGKAQVVGSSVIVVSSTDAAEKLAEVAYPEDDRLKDEAGVLKARKKKAKRIKEAMKAAEGGKDDTAPETANDVLGLNRDHGGDGWDYSEEELFSDEELERFDFEDQLVARVDQPEDNKDIEAAAPADEDAAELWREPEDEKPDVMTGYGQQLEVLLEQPLEVDGDRQAAAGPSAADDDCSEGGSDLEGDLTAPPLPGGVGSGDAAASPRGASSPTAVRLSSAMGTSSPPSAAIPAIVGLVSSLGSSKPTPAEPAATSPTPAAAAAASAAVPPSVEASPVESRGGAASPSPADASPCASGAPLGKDAAVSLSAITAVARPRPSPVVKEQSQPAPVASVAAQATTVAPAPAHGDIKSRVVQFLRKSKGRCSLQALTQEVGLTNKTDSRWNAFVAVLKETTKQEKVPGQKRTVLVLKSEFLT